MWFMIVLIGIVICCRPRRTQLQQRHGSGSIHPSGRSQRQLQQLSAALMTPTSAGVIGTNNGTFNGHALKIVSQMVCEPCIYIPLACIGCRNSLLQLWSIDAALPLVPCLMSFHCTRDAVARRSRSGAVAENKVPAGADDSAKRVKRAEPAAPAADGRRRAIPAPAARGAAPAAETPEPGEFVADAPAAAPAARKRASEKEKERDEKPAAEARSRAAREPRNTPDQAAVADKKQPAARSGAAAPPEKAPRETTGGSRVARSRDESEKAEKPAATAAAAGEKSGRSSRVGGKDKEKDKEKEARAAIPARKEPEKVCRSPKCLGNLSSDCAAFGRLFSQFNTTQKPPSLGQSSKQHRCTLPQVPASLALGRLQGGGEASFTLQEHPECLALHYRRSSTRQRNGGRCQDGCHARPA